MSIELEKTFPTQPSTERARRTPLSYHSRGNNIVYGSGKLVVIRNVEKPEHAELVYSEHLQPVSTVAFSPSGFYVASGDLSGQVRVWNTTGDEVVTKGPYQATSGKLNGVAWCSESSRIIAVGDGKERFGHGFTADSGNTIGEVSGHSAEVNAVAIRPSRPMRAVSVGEDGNTIFYEGPPFRFARSISKHVNSISDVAYAPDGAHFVTGGCDRKMGLYDGLNGDFKDWLETGHEGMILSVAFVNATHVLSASADCSVRLTDISSKKTVKVWQLPKTLDNQQTGVVAAGEDLAISIGLNGDIYYWKTSEDKPVRVVQGHQKSVTALAQDGKNALFSGSVEGTVVQWGPKEGGRRIDEAGHEGPVSGLVGDLWSAGWDKKLKKIGSDEILTLDEQPTAVTQTGKSTVGVSEGSLELAGDAKKHIALDGRGTCAHALDDVVAVGFGNHAAIYSLPALDLLHKFDARQSEVSAVRISPNKKYLAVGDASGKILLYSMSDYSIVTSRWTFHTSRVMSIDWTPDSQRVVTGATDTNIFIYNVEKPGRNIKYLGAHKDGVNQVLWDENLDIVSGGADGSVKKWKVTAAK